MSKYIILIALFFASIFFHWSIFNDKPKGYQIYMLPILQGAISSFITLFCYEILIDVQKRYLNSRWQGTYKRITIFNKMQKVEKDTVWEELKNYPVATINLKYLGNRRYKAEKIQYDGGEVYLSFTLQENCLEGSGSYQYHTKEDFGVLNIVQDLVNKNRLKIYRHNIYPSGIEAGYEIWERV